jgi:tetratricopeptide (TPR) repeat protein
LFFYKYRFLTAVKAKRIKLQSYIEYAFKRGMTFEAPHPLIDNLISNQHEFQTLSFKQLLHKLELHYTPQEQAYILTLFESFFPKKHLFEKILAHYYEFRRNGQLSLGYQIIRILMDFAPKQSLVKSLNNDVHFHKYAELYDDNSAKVFKSDPIFAEKTFYAGREKEQYFQFLTAFLEKKSRWMDLIALFISNRTTSFSMDEYMYLTSLLEKHLNEEESMFILEQLTLQSPAFLPLKQDLFNHYMKVKSIRKILELLSDYEFQLSAAQLRDLGNILEQSNADAFPLEPHELKKVAETVINLFPEKTEKLINQSVKVLLRTQEPKDILAWLNSDLNVAASLPIVEKIVMMVKLSESLDDMQTLGEIYFEFQQFEKAVECFSWEMELNPSDINPLKWLSKTYHEMGQNQESEVYQQLSINMQKWA